MKHFERASNNSKTQNSLGIALGSGAARGIAHLGVLRSLSEQNIEPQIIAGSSIGAFIGACYAAGKFDEIEEWFRQLTLKKLISYLDPKLTSRGGLADGAQFVHYMKTTYGDLQFTDLEKNLVVVATDLGSGREVWIESGSVWEAVRASMAYPGIISPVHMDKQFLLDGGLVNPVPVIACRAKGAHRVIAVNLNAEMMRESKNKQQDSSTESTQLIEQSLLGKISGKVIERVSPLLKRYENSSGKSKIPYNTIDVLSASINIMQDRITRSRLAGEPPDIMLTPRLGHVGMFEIDRFEEIFAEGKRVADKEQWNIELD